jgi:hypothetical protein
VLESLAVDVFALEIPSTDAALVLGVDLLAFAPEIPRGLLLKCHRVG